MPTQTVTLQMPGPLYDQLMHRAVETQRSFEEETLDVLAAVLPGRGELSSDLKQAIDSLVVLDDAALWQAAESRLADDVASVLESLHDKRDCGGLTDSESQQLAALLRQYERQMLVRAQAAALLRERGHDVTRLVNS
jgi:plasmid stability protein